MTAEAQRRYRAAHPERVAASEARYIATPEGRERRRAAQKAWKQRNRTQAREHNRILQRVRYHVATGQLAKSPCIVCGDLVVQAHHHKGYAPEHELDVVWLCASDHAAAHRAVAS